jgi:RNA polymerase-binding transcription factor DksA
MVPPALTAAQQETLRARLAERIALAEAAREPMESFALREALARMEDGGYGVCTDCESAIRFDRLLAQPHALRCIRCETERDRLRARPSLPAV